MKSRRHQYIFFLNAFSSQAFCAPRWQCSASQRLDIIWSVGFAMALPEYGRMFHGGFTGRCSQVRSLSIALDSIRSQYTGRHSREEQGSQQVSSAATGDTVRKWPTRREDHDYHFDLRTHHGVIDLTPEQYCILISPVVKPEDLDQRHAQTYWLCWNEDRGVWLCLL